LFRHSVELKPDSWPGYANIMNTQWLLGDEEGAWKTGEEMKRVAGGRPGRAPDKFYDNVDTLTWNLQAWRAGTLPDGADEIYNVGSSVFGSAVADIDARLHDATDARLRMLTARDDPNDPTIEATKHFVSGMLALESGDTSTAVTAMEAFGRDFANPAVSSQFPGYNCWIAPAEEAAGHPDLADAALKAAGHFVDCYRFRADIIDHRGDWLAAERAYAEAVAIAPDLPAAYYSWGLALARHDQPERAVEKLAAANQRGPHWADPLKAWGDVLARQGKWRDAVAKYDAALLYAPAWVELKRARDAAAAHAR